MGKVWGEWRFCLYPRKNGIYYAELLHPEGARVLYRSTGSKNRDEAAAIVGRWLAEGFPSRKAKVKKPVKDLLDFNAVMQYIEKSDVDAEQAIAMAQALKKRGLLNFNYTMPKHGQQDFIKFLYDFWDYEKSLYLKDKRAHGKSVTQRTCIEARRHIASKWEPVFKGRPRLQT